tara:strand:- start:4143 stop:4436 length:294 start_codon:yes stop_codon:yes gene_type:complete
MNLNEDLKNSLELIKATEKAFSEQKQITVKYYNLLAKIERFEGLAEWHKENSTNKEYYRGQADALHLILLDEGFYEQEQVKAKGFGRPSGGGRIMGM